MSEEKNISQENSRQEVNENNLFVRMDIDAIHLMDFVNLASCMVSIKVYLFRFHI